MKSVLSQLPNYPASYWNTLPVDNFHCIILPKAGSGGIYIGNIYAANDFQKHISFNICSVLTVEKFTSVKYEGSQQIIFHKIIPIDKDEPGDLFTAFYNAYQFIENCLSLGNVLIHCIDCVTISPVIAISYLLYKYRCTVEKGWELVKAQNPFAHVRHGKSDDQVELFSQLLRLEQSLNIEQYLTKPVIYKTEFVEKKLTPLEKIKEREENRKNFIQSVYSQYHLESDEPLDYEAMKKRYLQSQGQERKKS